MHLSDNAQIVLQKRYYRKDENGDFIEDWAALVDRVASNIAGGDKELQEKFYALLDSGDFLPNSPTLMNAGADLQQLSACFVLPIEDSMESIFETVKNAALIHKSGGGTGFSFSRLREANARVRSTNGVSSGPISFMKVFNSATDAVKQGGTRRGANMAILSVDHPQIMDFITCKKDPNDLTNFNISVALTEAFMRAVSEDKEYDLISPHNGKVAGQLSASKVFELIVEMAHKNGEPGIVFLDRINQVNPTPALGEIESTNPCGEQPLLPNEACNLGSINLAALATEDDLNWARLKEVVRDSVDFLDCVIDQSKYPLETIAEMSRSNRKIGLGVMGWADLLYQLKIPYMSQEAVDLAERVMEYIDFEAKTRSMELALQKGSFPNFPESIYAQGELNREGKYCDWAKLARDIQQNGLRNATLTTIAPTGTISMIADTSSGVEPQFSLVYIKSVMDTEKLLYVNKWFEAALEEWNLLTQELLEEVSQSGSVAHMSDVPGELQEIFQTAHDIDPAWHIRMQAAFQKYTDNAVSKTINFPNNARIEDIREAYLLAYRLGCKGVTVYRDGSRDNQVLSVGTGSQQKSSEERKVAPRQRPEVTHGVTQRLETGCGHMYVTINTDSQGACEAFVQMGKVGGCASAQLEAIARLASLALRSRIKIEAIIRQLKGIRCQSPMWHKGKMITSCGDAVGQALENFLSMHVNGELKSISIKAEQDSALADSKPKAQVATCPDCGSGIEHVEGCLKCPSCGWSKC
ncbi:MAG: vitamin B12-dependent ribonucleotide reductase [Candidatus Cloacimonetes bacterium]|jgi:ribonucleoside-diphosphate reductase alpha chain|nr:vitamin B12-dependent ribonucleotide reductase [Candidatus Cloacimonadota bacterium]MCB5286756.1 vitamin B12-dependent ribonucleotide reductase [Candidatus Cloacimonadota bacterium]MCK9184183.1 vitamin B12-dependent ribonucleotide reductase [Candidatus Cloacimonadota bacterium]MCK9583521.1 vitamin B12-dependent ribonucleotide reductase [Candidatus Cloacimonadota bacterium]MDY0229077.1 vitamin B12-dependent ribonucleotide reductase [Candidatus Cloacimonadaceae bacterium]